MPTYEYLCPDGHQFDVIKRVADLDREEHCDRCSQVASRQIARTHFYGASDWDKAEFNPAFGTIVKNGVHRRQLAKQRGMEEIGNESPDKVVEHFDDMRAKKAKANWDSV